MKLSIILIELVKSGKLKQSEYHAIYGALIMISEDKSLMEQFEVDYGTFGVEGLKDLLKNA